MADKMYSVEKDIADRVGKLAEAGVSRTAAWKDCLSLWPDRVPSSYKGFYRYYDSAYNTGKTAVDLAIGSKLVESAMEGDFKSQHLYLTTKGGWGTTSPIENDDAEQAQAEKRQAILDKLANVIKGKTDDGTNESDA